MGPGGSMPHSQGLSNNSYSTQFPALIHISSRSILILIIQLKGFINIVGVNYILQVRGFWISEDSTRQMKKILKIIF